MVANLADAAYEQIEDLIVHCELSPGADIRMQDLQDRIGIGRTPVYQAVRRLSAETLIQIRPRDGLLISPISLKRDRRLLQLRRDMDRFSVQLAAEKLNADQRALLARLERRMNDRVSVMDVHEFNGYDRELDAIILDAAREPFLERTLRPLHTIFRRIGHVYLTQLGREAGLQQTISCHVDLLRAVGAQDALAASVASDRVIAFAESMLDRLEREVHAKFFDVRA